MNEANMGTTDTLMGVSIDVSATIVNRPNNYDGFKPAVIPHKILCDEMISHLVDICYQDYKKKKDDIERVVNRIIKNALRMVIEESGTNILIGTKYFMPSLIASMSRKFDKDYYPFESNDNFFGHVMDAYLSCTENSYDLIDPANYFIRLYSGNEETYTGMPLIRHRFSLFSTWDIGTKYYDFQMFREIYHHIKNSAPDLVSYYRDLCTKEDNKLYDLLIQKIRTVEDPCIQTYGIITADTSWIFE